MAEPVRVVVDAMGGDNAPAEPVKEAVEAVTEREDIDVILTGRQDVMEKELSKFQNYPKEKMCIRDRKKREYAPRSTAPAIRLISR